MSPILQYITSHGFALLLLAAALLTGVIAVGKRKLAPLLLGGPLFFLGLGGLAPESLTEIWLGAWLAGGALLLLLAMFLILLLSGYWWAPLGYVSGGLLFLGLGALVVGPIGQTLTESGLMVTSFEPAHPWWLLLIPTLVPAIIWFSFRSLAGLGPFRCWVAIGLRSSLIIFLALALAEVKLKHQNETTTVIFLADRSVSVPQEPYDDPINKGKTLDYRWERVKKFINESVEQRGPGHERDKAGLIVFGRRPRLELPPSDAPRFKLTEVAASVDGNYTDIAAALKLALASFPEGSAKRIVILSDGNENMGNAEEQARIAKLNGAQIDVVPLAAGLKNENEVMVQSIEAPAIAEEGTQLPIRVLLRNHNSNPVEGILTVRQNAHSAEGITTIDVDKPRRVRVVPGLTSFTFKQPLIPRQQSYTYEAEFIPEGVVVRGDELRALTGDRVQNNRATTHVVARGQRRVLLIEAKEGEHRNLELELRGRKMDILALPVDTLPKDKDRMAVFLSNFDCVVLANLPAETMSEEQMEMIRSNTHEQGCGLVMIGGPEGFGAGGWQNTPVEKALPVDSEIKALKVQGKGGLVMIMHACEMPEGNYWEKKIAKLAMDKLSSVDEIGILGLDFGAQKWHIPLQEIGDKREWLKGQVDKINPGDMPDFDTPLQMAYKELMDPKRELATKHVIIISDGDPQMTNQGLLAQMRKDKVTVSTVGVATHGAPQAQALANIARATNGRFHNVTNPNMLPAIYLKETRLVSQSFVYEKRFQPKVNYASGPTDRLGEVPPLWGFVRTSAKTSPLVEVPIESPPFAEQKFPILAHWHYGLGKSAAFTSDARSQPGRRFWDREWADSEIYVKFWEQAVTWALRPTESKRLAMSTEFRDGKVRVIVDARDDQGRPLDDFKLRAGITSPTGKTEGQQRVELKFEQKNSGFYEAEFKADEAGSYFVNVQASRKVKKKDADGKIVESEDQDSVRAGVTIPYSPEYADLESNAALLEKLRAMTDGKSYEDDAQALADAASSGDVFRRGLPSFKNLQPIWYWLLFLTGSLLFFDVAVRRIAVEMGAVVGTAQTVWDRLRGRMPAPAKAPEFFDRLRSRKEQVGETLQKSKGARRFESTEAPTSAPPPGAEATPERREPIAPRPARPKPAPTGDGGDYLSRLKKAKQRAMQDKDDEEKA